MDGCAQPQVLFVLLVIIVQHPMHLQHCVHQVSIAPLEVPLQLLAQVIQPVTPLVLNVLLAIIALQIMDYQQQNALKGVIAQPIQ